MNVTQLSSVICWLVLTALCLQRDQHHLMQGAVADRRLLPQQIFLAMFSSFNMSYFCRLPSYKGGPAVNYATHEAMDMPGLNLEPIEDK